MNSEESYFMACGICGYETNNDKFEFHRMDVCKLREDGTRTIIDICDICHSIHGAFIQYHANREIPLSYLTFVQGLHYINEKISKIRCNCDQTG